MTPPAFVNGDWVYLRSDELSTNLQPEGVQLVLASSVLGGDRQQWPHWLMFHQSVGAATLVSGDALLLRTHAECSVSYTHLTLPTILLV